MSSHNVLLSEHIQQMDKHQDQTYIGDGVNEETGEKFKYAMITDGHGRHDCIRVLRSITKADLSTMLGKKNPVFALANYVKSRMHPTRPYGSGATLCFTKIFEDRIECVNVGDSQFAVFKDGELLHLSTEHTWENAKDKERLLATDPFLFFEPSKTIKVISKTKMISAYTEYAVWADGNRLACTQALGHGSRTGFAPDTISIPLEKGSTYKVIIGSDGIWDMVIKDDPEDIKRFSTMNGNEIVESISARWLQEWDMAPSETSTEVEKGRFQRHECDDISLVVADILPVE